MTTTQEQWDALSEKGQWDIKVALRGPDSYYGETLKWFTTAVIRGTVRKLFRVGGTVNRDLKLVILPINDGIYQAKKEKTSWNSNHFVEHIMTAADWLQIPVLYIPASLWHEVMQMDYPVLAVKRILEAAEKDVAACEIEPNPKPKYYLKRESWASTKKINELRRHYTKQLGGDLSAKNYVG